MFDFSRRPSLVDYEFDLLGLYVGQDFPFRLMILRNQRQRQDFYLFFLCGWGCVKCNLLRFQFHIKDEILMRWSVQVVWSQPVIMMWLKKGNLAPGGQFSLFTFWWHLNTWLNSKLNSQSSSFLLIFFNQPYIRKETRQYSFSFRLTSRWLGMQLCN